MLLSGISAVAFAAVGAATPSPKTLKSDLTILIDNDLRGIPPSPLPTDIIPDQSPGATSSTSSSAAILLGAKKNQSDALAACQSIGEQLWSPQLNTTNIKRLLDHLVYQKRVDLTTQLWISPATGGNTTRTIDGSGKVTEVENSKLLGVLCTQTAPYSSEKVTDTGERWRVGVQTGGLSLTGYRDRLSFRFLGIRYAPQPKRFAYSTLFKGSGEADALSFGPQCAQGSVGSGSEDCLFLNVWTPYLPGSSYGSEKKKLKPVGVW